MGKAVFKRKAWWIDYRVNGERKREKIGSTKELAEIVLHKRMVEIAENKFLDIKKVNKIKFEDFADEYFRDHCKPNHRSIKKGSASSLKVLRKHFSGRCLDEITPQLIEQFKAKRLKEVKPATVNRALACLKSLYNKAIVWKKFDGKNPVKEVKLLKENNKRLRFLEKDEIMTLVDNCNEDLKPIVIVAVNTGMRHGEILNLKWRDIDFNRGIIYLYVTKNGEKREIPMNEHVKTALLKVKKHRNSEYIFVRSNGTRIKDIRKSFFTALENSGITDFHFHDLRHSFASQLAISGVDLNTIRDLLGHKTIQMTLRYAHLSPNHRKHAVAVLDRQMGSFWAPKPSVEGEAKQAGLATSSNTLNYTLQGR